MIVSFKNRMLFSGECDGLVYYWNRRLDKLIARRYVVPRESNSNRRLGGISRHLKSLELSEAYKEDLKLYVTMYNNRPREKQMLSWRNAFLTMMYALAKQYDTVDLSNITRAQVESEQLPCQSVKEAVDAGLLPYVEGCERLNNKM